MMGETTKIPWTDASWNPWIGCRRVSPGCDNCYADRDMTRYGKDFSILKKTADRTFYSPIHWKKGRKIFVCSWSDFFNKAADKWRPEAWAIMLHTPQHTYQILTKREQLMVKWAESHPWPDHIWAGVSVENQDFAYRLDALAKVPAKVRFVSCEPLLGPLDLTKWLNADCQCGDYRDMHPDDGPCDANFPNEPNVDCMAYRPDGGLSWVIAGGESGPRARPCHPDWIRGLRDQCQEAGVPYFFKQWGEWRPMNGLDGVVNNPLCTYLLPDGSEHRHIQDDDQHWEGIARVGTKAAGALLDGQEHREFPA